MKGKTTKQIKALILITKPFTKCLKQIREDFPIPDQF